MALSGPGGNGGDDADLEGVGGVFADINITPLTDIFLVLLIIFMVTTTAIAEQNRDDGGLKVDLPKGGSKVAGMAPHDLAIAVLEDGRTVVGGRVVDEPNLAAILEQSAKANPDTLVLVQ